MLEVLITVYAKEIMMTKKTTKNTNKDNEVKNWYYNEEAFGYSTIKKEN